MRRRQTGRPIACYVSLKPRGLYRVQSIAVCTATVGDTFAQYNQFTDQSSCSHDGLCCAVATSCLLLYEQCALSMGRPTFRLPTARTFSNPSFCNSKQRKISGMQPSTQNLVDVGRRGGSLRREQFWAYFWFFPFSVLFVSPPGHTVGPTTTNKGSKRVFPRKTVPFEV